MPLLAAPGVLPVLANTAHLDGARSVTLDSANLAAVLACTVVITAAAIGLYRPEVCVERRRLLVNTSVAGILAFPADPGGQPDEFQHQLVAIFRCCG